MCHKRLKIFFLRSNLATDVLHCPIPARLLIYHDIIGHSTCNAANEQHSNRFKELMKLCFKEATSAHLRSLCYCWQKD